MLALIQQVIADSTSTLKTWLDASDIAEHIVTALGIVAAGYWTYALFVRQRQRFPRARLELRIDSRRLENGIPVLLIAATLSNVGSTMICIRRTSVIVYRVAPLSQDVLDDLLRDYKPLEAGRPCTLPWRRSGRREEFHAPGTFEVEPGEADVCSFELAVKRDIRTVRVTVHIDNVAKRRSLWKFLQGDPIIPIGWSASGYHDVAQAAPDAQAVRAWLDEVRS